MHSSVGLTAGPGRQPHSIEPARPRLPHHAPVHCGVSPRCRPAACRTSRRLTQLRLGCRLPSGVPLGILQQPLETAECSPCMTTPCSVIAAECTGPPVASVAPGLPEEWHDSPAQRSRSLMKTHCILCAHLPDRQQLHRGSGARQHFERRV